MSVNNGPKNSDDLLRRMQQDYQAEQEKHRDKKREPSKKMDFPLGYVPKADPKTPKKPSKGT